MAKRSLDFVASCFVLVATSPIMLMIISAIIITDRCTPFYFDERVGRNGNRFRCIKFRTMRADPSILSDYLAANPDEAEQYRISRKLTHDPRTTALGTLLRKTSLDELPQFINVVRGEMSIVGPRPVTESEWLQRTDVDQHLLVSVRPGITGLWQISGRCDLSNQDRAALDSSYALRSSLLLDVSIIARTPGAVLSRRGAR